ncbi:nucleoside 2-deoxyribosyltransferase [Candidatus Tisiphia endosymbiont of Sialis lutaria]|uniref:nucleoside 2-deoxyribosyltransferase n=1 Tax=Candidatus Tisiphia endosymbiont of Sialis lutaria TaxID=2029164 RepID=UPI00312CBAFC
MINHHSVESSNNSVTKKSYNLYFAGPLFTNKDLIGNLYLASAIEEASSGKYKFILPQNLEQRDTHAKHIKNNDLKAIKEADGGIFSFDGTDPDSGTIVEFIQSKFLDKPAVLYRSDIRLGGDQKRTQGNPWNLMMSNYPRAKVVIIEDIVIKYQDFHKEHSGDVHSISKALSLLIAQPIIKALDEVFATLPLVLPDNLDKKMLDKHFHILNDLDTH